MLEKNIENHSPKTCFSNAVQTHWLKNPRAGECGGLPVTHLLKGQLKEPLVIESGPQWAMNRETTGLQESRIKDVDETTKIVDSWRILTSWNPSCMIEEARCNDIFHIRHTLESQLLHVSTHLVFIVIFCVV